jgi:hypothetical protein
MGNGDTDGAASSFRLGITYASPNAYLLVFSKNANALTCNRRFPITQGVPHHVLINLDLSAPNLQVFVDGAEVAYDTGLAGTTLTAAQPIGGSTLPMRWLSGAASGQEFFGAVGQFALWQEVYGSRITEQHIRSFYNDGPADLAGLRINGVSAFVFLNALPSGSPLAIANAGTSGGVFTDQLAGGTVAALDTAGLDAPMLEQIDNFPAGYTLPVGTEVRLYRRSTKGVWSVF